jgi:hypothetical protein
MHAIVHRRREQLERLPAALDECLEDREVAVGCSNRKFHAARPPVIGFQSVIALLAATLTDPRTFAHLDADKRPLTGTRRFMIAAQRNPILEPERGIVAVFLESAASFKSRRTSGFVLTRGLRSYDGIERDDLIGASDRINPRSGQLCKDRICSVVKLLTWRRAILPKRVLSSHYDCVNWLQRRAAA